MVLPSLYPQSTEGKKQKCANTIALFKKKSNSSGPIEIFCEIKFAGAAAAAIIAAGEKYKGAPKKAAAALSNIASQ